MDDKSHGGDRITETNLRKVLALFLTQALPPCIPPADVSRVAARMMRILDADTLGLSQSARRIWYLAVEPLQFGVRRRRSTFEHLKSPLELMLKDLKLMASDPAFRHRGSFYRATRVRSHERLCASDPRVLPQEDLAPKRPTLGRSLGHAMEAHFDSAARVHYALSRAGLTICIKTLYMWFGDQSSPRQAQFTPHLGLLEQRYGLSPGSLLALSRLRPRRPRGFEGHKLRGGAWQNERWHLPADYDALPPERQDAIQSWIQANVIPGCTTPFRRWHAAMAAAGGALALPGARRLIQEGRPAHAPPLASPGRTFKGGRPDPTAAAGQEPLAEVDREVCELLQFKMRTFTPIGMTRSGYWSTPTAAINLRHLEGILGFIAGNRAGPSSEDRSIVRLGHLAFPSVWDEYLRWRHSRRGFYTQTEVGMLGLPRQIFCPSSGWAAQVDGLGEELGAIPGLVSAEQAASAAADWPQTCRHLEAYTQSRAKDVARLQLRHRDPFEALRPVLSHPKPLSLYCRIADEIVRALGEAPRRRIQRAELQRALIMFHIAIQTGFRQRNLRELLVCADNRPRGLAELERLRRGELSFCERSRKWSILIPACAFKNAGSSFFQGGALGLDISDRGGLYEHLERYLREDRPALIGKGEDPGTLLVKTKRRSVRNLEMTKGGLYLAWYDMIVRYGIYNPYTGRGAVEGLLAHGPHSVRDVLATHILKSTGSFELAAYAIQDTAGTVMRHYGRFAPSEKARLASEVASRSWIECQELAMDGSLTSERLDGAAKRGV